MEKKRDDTQQTVMQSIDWKSIRESLTWEASQRERDLLRRRAAQYAAPIKQTEAAAADESIAEKVSVLAFRLGDENYGLDVAAVRGVRPLSKITPIPGIPPFYRGVINLRGQILTVLDLQIFFSITTIATNGSLPYPLHRELVLVDSHGLHLGLLATHVEGVVWVQHRTLQPLDTTHYAQGITTERLIVLNLEAIFTDPRLIIGYDQTD
jgi:purine-binding chemotaxis protein CheW